MCAVGCLVSSSGAGDSGAATTLATSLQRSRRAAAFLTKLVPFAWRRRRRAWCSCIGRTIAPYGDGGSSIAVPRPLTLASEARGGAAGERAALYELGVHSWSWSACSRKRSQVAGSVSVRAYWSTRAAGSSISTGRGARFSNSDIQTGGRVIVTPQRSFGAHGAFHTPPASVNARISCSNFVSRRAAAPPHPRPQVQARGITLVRPSRRHDRLGRPDKGRHRQDACLPRFHSRQVWAPSHRERGDHLSRR